MEKYNKRTSLVIDYHMNWEKEVADIYSGEFDTFDEALSYMERLLPEDWYGDDGYDEGEWQDALDNGDDDVFYQAAANTNPCSYFLAQLRPVL